MSAPIRQEEARAGGGKGLPTGTLGLGAQPREGEGRIAPTTAPPP